MRGERAEQTFEALMLLMAPAFTRVLAFHARLDREALWKGLRLRRVTLAYLAECLLLSLPEAAGLFSADG